MKTRISRYLLMIASVLTFGYARAAEPVRTSESINSAASLERALDKALNRHLTFPWLEQGNMTGKVMVSFNIDADGHVEVISCTSANERLRDYVLRKLARIDIGTNASGIWKTTHMVIDFHPEQRG